MHAPLSLLLLLAALSQAQNYHRPVFPKDQQYSSRDYESRIVNGKEAEKGQFPYQVGMYLEKSSFCGGSIIDKKWILTAAHCVHEMNFFTVFLGAHQINLPIESGRTVYNSRVFYKHEKYNPLTLDSDVAVIKLPVPIPTSENIAIIPLPPRSFNNRDFAGQEVRVSGWGRLSDSARWITNKLQYVDLTVITNEKCKATYQYTITDNIVCAIGPNGKSTCSGDSGGPLVIVGNGTNKTTHFAVVSFVSKAGCGSGAPSGYVRTYKFLDWIHDKTGIPIQD